MDRQPTSFEEKANLLPLSTQVEARSTIQSRAADTPQVMESRVPCRMHGDHDETTNQPGQGTKRLKVFLCPVGSIRFKHEQQSSRTYLRCEPLKLNISC